jgi:excisionase family DNA binding protein
MLPEMMTVKEAAKALHVSAASVYGWVETGVLACYRLGAKGRRGAIRLAAVDIVAFLESLKTEKGPPAIKPVAFRKSPGTKLQHLKLKPNKTFLAFFAASRMCSVRCVRWL